MRGQLRRRSAWVEPGSGAAADDRQPLLRVSQLGKSFGGVRAVDAISFDVDRNEIFGIAGPNGAGKTTLFNALTGVPFHADRGTIEFKGRSIERRAPHEIFRAGMARTFQRETCFDSLTVADNLRIGASFGRVEGRKERALAIAAALEMTGLNDIAVEVAGTLKLYDKKRVMVATALVARPALLMLDEPAGGLSTTELEQLKALILNVNESGVAIVLIEHVLALLFGVSSRLMIMDHGNKLVEGRPRDVAKNPSVIEAYLGERGAEAFNAVAR